MATVLWLSESRLAISAEPKPSASRQKISNSRVDRSLSGESPPRPRANVEPLRDVAGERLAAGGDLLDRADEHVRRAALGHIAARPRRQRLLYEQGVFVHAEDQHLGFGIALHDAPHRLEPADTRQASNP